MAFVIFRLETESDKCVIRHVFTIYINVLMSKIAKYVMEMTDGRYDSFTDTKSFILAVQVITKIQ